MKTKLIKTKDYLLLIDEEAKIGKYVWDIEQKYIREDVSKYNITDFDVEIIAYYPLTKEAKELDLPLLPPFEDTIPNSGYEEGMFGYTDTEVRVAQNAFKEGYKTAQSLGKLK